jgi:RNA polymerase-binding transcription factor DksA
MQRTPARSIHGPKNPTKDPVLMAKPAPKKSTAKAAPAAKQAKPATPATPASKTAAKKAAAPKPPAAKAPAPAPAKQPAPKKAAPAPAKKAAAAPAPEPAPAPKSSPFDAKFLDAQRQLLLEERAKLLGQAENLEGEAAALMENLDPGDVQFDDESGEGDSLVVERERDLALSAQARQMIADIDAALQRISDGSYGFSVISGRPIPKDRLRAIPWARELVEEKVGGLGSRR